MSDKKLNLKYVVCLPIALILFAFLWFFPIEPVTIGNLTFGYSLFFGDGVLSQVEVIKSRSSVLRYCMKCPVPFGE